MHRLLFLPLFVLTFLMSATATAEDARPPIHVEIVLDSSGSMKTNDPNRLSALGAMIFADLAAADDSLGVQSMKKPRYVVEALSQVEENRTRLRDASKNLKFKGATDCQGPLKQASKELAELRARRPDARQFVVFLSDGLCPEDSLDQESSALGRDGVKIFSIGLFSAETLSEGDPERALKNMATSSDGQYFRAHQASDLPAKFASILGKILGSEAVPIPIQPGKASAVSLDGYVRDASLIVTSPRAVRVTRAEGPDGKVLALPTKSAPYDSRGRNFFASANSNGQGQHYTVLSIQKPESGEWNFIIDAPSTASALLIQNYALEPKLEVGASALTTGSKTSVACTIEGPDGKALQDPTFLDKVGVEITVVTPDDKRLTAPMERSNFQFLYDLNPENSGRYQLRARAFMKKGGLNKTTAWKSLTAIEFDLAFADDANIDLGTVKAGSTSEVFELSMANSRLFEAADIQLAVEGINQITPDPSNASLDPKDVQVRVKFQVDSNHPGGAVEGKFVVSAGAESTSIPIVGTVVPISFWEQWGDTIILVGSALLGLLLLLFIFYGIISPYGFPDEARLNWGETVKRLDKNTVVIREIPKTGRGFYKNAKLVVGGATSYFPVGGTELVTLEASGPTQVTITAADGVELMRVNKFDHAKEKPVESNSTGMTSGEIFRAGDIYLRLR